MIRLFLYPLAIIKNWWVRSRVARHPNCPILILEKLSNDEYWQVRYRVAEHPNCPQYLKDYFLCFKFVGRNFHKYRV